MRIVYAAFLLVFVAVIAIFCVQNLTTASVSFLGWSLSMPLPLLVLVVYLLGMVTGWGFLSIIRRSIARATESPE